MWCKWLIDRLLCAVLISTVALAGRTLSAQVPEQSAATSDVPKTIGQIERLAPEFDQLIPPAATIDVLAGGFEWSEGPVWVPRKHSLLFSDIPRNQIVSWNAQAGIRVFMDPSGYTGKDKFGGTEPGTNGLTLDSHGRLVMCCHGDRSIRRLESDGSLTTLAARYDGKRFNSPNDLVYHSNGNLYFTDPPYGLPGGLEGPQAELDFSGVYCLSPDGKVTLLTKTMTRPNGIGLSPDEKTLYVAQSDPKQAIWRLSRCTRTARWAQVESSTTSRNGSRNGQGCPTAWLWTAAATCGPPDRAACWSFHQPVSCWASCIPGRQLPTVRSEKTASRCS